MSRMLLREHIDNALHSLRRTRSRTLLTTLGVAIGVCSITTILALSQGVIGLIEHQVSDMHGTIAVIRPGYPEQQNAVNLNNPLGSSAFNTSTLSTADYQSITALPGVKQVAPIMLINGMMKGPHGSSTVGSIVATTPSFATLNNLQMDSGQFLDETTADNTVVIGDQLALELFNTDSPIGQQFSMRGQDFTVIGVMKRVDNPINYNNFDLDMAAYINIDSGVNFHQGSAQIQQIDLRVDDKKQLPGVVREVTKTIRANHLGEQDFTVATGDAIATPTNQLFIVATVTMTAIAAISLVVGGVGIMNIMLVGVAERTREIGLRKAVGASSQQITMQFLIESLIISLAGGLIGYCSGYVIAFSISTFLPFNPTLNWQIALLAFGISIIVGLIFGAYPAFRAARKDPIESLLVYH